MSTDLIPIGDVERMALAVAKSKLFGVQSPEQAMALMLIAQAEGRHPAIAARDYHIIQGRPALKADAILARFQEAGGRVEWHAYTNEKADATFMHPSGGSLRLGWTMADAKAAGLTGKDVWRQYPRAMLRARVISEGIRTVFPGVLCGFYTPEEVGDLDSKAPAETPTIRAMGPVEVVTDDPPPPMARQTADSTSQAPTIDAVRTAAREAIGRVGRQAVMETLSSLGWERADEIPPEARGDVIAVLGDMRAQEAA